MMWVKPKESAPKKHPLPVGLQGFNDWSDRIIQLAGLPATPESQKYALAHMLTNLPPQECEESDEYFVKAMRRAAANQVAIYYREKIFPEVKARLAKEEQEKQQAEATASQGGDGKVLGIKGVQRT